MVKTRAMCSEPFALGDYMHERMWIRISFGRTERPEYEI
jgi:uncharacterized membrane protein